jgi:hypothetical protein
LIVLAGNINDVRTACQTLRAGLEGEPLMEQHICLCTPGKVSYLSLISFSFTFLYL